MKIRTLFVSSIGLFLFFPAHAEEPSITTLPASVVKTIPQSGAREVDAETTKKIEVTFSKEMTDKSWSWSQISDKTFPKILGTPRYLDDKRTCVVDVELEPNRTYVLWLNSPKFKNFKDVDGNPSVPYLLVFETK
jgi:hypothetical protein